MTDYGVLAEDQLLQLERGPQGGHHIWIAVRMRNLRRSGSTTMITSRIEGDPEPVVPSSFVFTFDPDEGAYCKIWGRPDPTTVRGERRKCATSG